MRLEIQTPRSLWIHFLLLCLDSFVLFSASRASRMSSARWRREMGRKVPGLKSQETAGRVPHLPRVPMTLSEPLLLSASTVSDLGQGWRRTADACPSSPLAGQPASKDTRGIRVWIC